MSGIYIPDMKMPKMPEKMEQGQEVPYVDVRVFADGDAVISTGVRPYYKKYQAIELPPHGRLIDADKVETERHGNNSQRIMWNNIRQLLSEAETIIPADREEDA